MQLQSAITRHISQVDFLRRNRYRSFLQIKIRNKILFFFLILLIHIISNNIFIIDVERSQFGQKISFQN